MQRFLENLGEISTVLGIDANNVKERGKGNGITSIRNKEEFTTLKDYFILLYGVLNCCVILYCCICFIAKIWDLLHNIITV